MKEYKVFVINISNQRWEKYDDRYIRFEGCNGKQELSLEDVNDKYHFRYNASPDHRYNVAGCSESHLRLIDHLIENKINNAIVIEDDTLIDFDRLEELDDVKGFCYVGGWMRAPILTKQDNFIKPTFEKGLHTIDTNKFVITSAMGYYYETYHTAELFKTKKHPKRRAIDVEFVNIQKKYNDIQFIYPAIARCHLPDAKNGFTWGKGYNIKDDLSFY
tara:strand:- start:1597 stop:2247 length:651 start_codon:yes stop_codon:yes gene_type:complete